MGKLLRFLTKNALIILLMSALLIAEGVSFAWLSTVWSSGDFSLTTAYTNVPEMEMWTYHDDEDASGWYKTYAETDTKIPNDKSIDNISQETYSSGSYPTTFTKSGDFSLYFGKITNLVQQTDNVPVYLKFKIKLPAKSSNTITVSYDLPDNYIRPYRSLKTPAELITDSTANKNIVSKLNNKTGGEFDYKFLNLTYYFDGIGGQSDTEYSITDGEDLPDGFEDLFDEESSYVKTIEAGTDEIITRINSDKAEDEFYLYMRFEVPTKTIRDALLNTTLKDNMPVYLIFDTQFDIDVRSEGYNS